MSGECVVQINNILSEDRSYLYEGLTLIESKSVKLWENAGRKICEAALTADQIQQLFQQVEKNATAAGGNRTAIGQGKDVADAVNKAWTDLKTKVQNSGPISNIDQKYDQAAQKLKQATGGDQGVMKYVQMYRDFAKKHPIAQGLIYSALIAAAGISGAGVGGAAALGLLKMTDKLLQGEKFSSAAYSGAKTGAGAYAAGQVGQAIKGGSQGMPPDSAYKTTSYSNQTYDVPSQNPEMSRMMAAGQKAQGYTSSNAHLSQMMRDNPLPKNFGQFKESRYVDRKLTVYTWALNESVGRTQGGVQLTNEGVMDAIKGAASKAGQWAQTKGKNLTTKVTADKLQSAWKKAGSPMDSEDLAKVFKNAGVPEDMVKQVYTDMKVPLPGSPKEAPPVNTSTGAPQSTPPADPAVTGPAPKPTPKKPKSAPATANVAGNQTGATTPPPANNPAATTPPVTNPAQDAQANQQTQPKQSLWNKLKQGFTNPGGSTPPADKDNIANDALPVWRKFLQQYLAGYGNDPANIPAAAKAFAAKNYPEAGKAEIEAGIKNVSDAKTADAYILKLANRALANYKAGISPDPPTKTHTGGKVKGQVSQTPNAIRQRNARAAKAGTAPTTTPTTTGGAGAFGQMANQLGGAQPNTMANTPVSKVNVASPNNPNQPQAKTANTARSAPATTTPAKVRPKYGQATAPVATTQVKGATRAGAPTPGEQAVLQQKIAAAQAAGKPTVQESVDLAEVLWRKMKRSQ